MKKRVEDDVLDERRARGELYRFQSLQHSMINKTEKKGYRQHLYQNPRSFFGQRSKGKKKRLPRTCDEEAEPTDNAAKRDEGESITDERIEDSTPSSLNFARKDSHSSCNYMNRVECTKRKNTGVNLRCQNDKPKLHRCVHLKDIQSQISFRKRTKKVSENRLTSSSIQNELTGNITVREERFFFRLTFSTSLSWD